MTLGGVSKHSTLPSCAGPSTWEDWAQATPGPKNFAFEFSSPTCGTVPGSYPYTLAQDIYHLFELGYNGASLTMTVYTSPTASSAGQNSVFVLSQVDGNRSLSSFKLVDEQPLNMLPTCGDDLPKGVLKATN